MSKDWPRLGFEVELLDKTGICWLRLDNGSRIRVQFDILYFIEPEVGCEYEYDGNNFKKMDFTCPKIEKSIKDALKELGLE